MGRVFRLILILGLIISFIYLYNYNQIKVFRVREINLDSKKLSNKIKITQISDFHSNDLINLDKLKEEIGDFNPDFIVLTGDIIDFKDRNLDTVSKLLENLSELDKAIYFVKGNHETNHILYKDLKAIMEDLDIFVLENSSKTVRFNEDKVNIIGLNFFYPGMIYEGKSIYTTVTEDLNLDYYNLLLIHSPNNIEELLNGGEDLILSGHTHGGQFRLPLIGPILAPGQGLFPKLDKGLFKVGGSTLYIDSGLGNSLAPIRAFNPVQITNIIIDKKY